MQMWAYLLLKHGSNRRLKNPVVSVGILGIGAAELGLYRAIESIIAVNILDAQTRKQRRALADVNFRAAQLEAVNDTLTLANQTRQAWINAVAAFEAVSYLKRAKATSDAGSELARKLGETGALNRAGQAREQAFNAELAGQLAQARLNADRAKEDLTKIDGPLGYAGRLLRFPMRCHRCQSRLVRFETSKRRRCETVSTFVWQSWGSKRRLRRSV